MMRALALFLGSAWSAIRSLATDDAYDKYLAHHTEVHAGSPMSRRAFYLRQQQEKWCGVSRCC